MKKIGRFALGGILSLLGVSTLASCADNASAAEEVLNKIIIQEDGEDVSDDFYIPKTVTVNGTAHEITWTSSDDSVLKFAAAADTSKYIADIRRAFDANTDVTFTASADVDGKKASAEFKVTVVGITPEVALTQAISALPIEATYKEKAEVQLPASTAEMTALENDFKETISFAYALGGEYTSTTLVENKLSMDPANGSDKVILNVTATSGDKTQAKEVKINVSSEIVYLTVEEATSVAAGTLVYIQGKVESIENDKYGNINIVDEKGNKILIYGMYQGSIEACYPEGVWLTKDNPAIRYDKWADADKVAVGDYVYLYGLRDTYNGTEQVKNTLLMNPFGTIEEALAAEENTMITVYGTVKSIASTTYGNVYIQDADGKEFYIYGLYKGAIEECYDGTTWLKKATRYDAWEEADKLKVGDVIAVYGLRTSYKDSPQLGNGLLQAVLKRAVEVTPEPEPETPTIVKIANPTTSLMKGKKAGDAFTCAAAKVVFMNVTDGVVICSTATGSFAIEIASGKEDVLPTGYAVGDTVSVSGTIGVAAKKQLSSGLVVAIGATVNKIADAEIAAPTFTAIDWATQGYNWLGSLSKDDMIGAYVEFTNVTFGEKPEYGYSSIDGTSYTKFVTPGNLEDYAGLFHCEPKDSDGNEVTTTDKYTIKAYVITPSTHKTDAASTKVRIFAVSIVKQAA